MRRGSVVKRAVAVAVLGFLVSGCAGKEDGRGPPHGARERAATAGKLLLIGLDGADWEIIDRLEDQGKLPNLARLRREGAWGILRSQEPLLSPIVWTTIATGRGPLDHGIFGFLTVRHGTTEPVRSDEREVRAFWNIAGDFGLKVGVVGWYATWPAEPVNGFMVSDRIGTHQVGGGAHDPDSGLVSPPELLPEVERLKQDVDARTGPEAAARFFTSGEPGKGLYVPIEQERLDTFVGILRTSELYRALVPVLLDRFDPDLFAVYFEGTDAVGHLFAEFAAPPLPGVDPRKARFLAPAFDRFYEYIDGVLGDILERVDPARTTVVIVSDHGFKTGERRLSVASRENAETHAPVWHRPEGILLMWGRGVRRGIRLPDRSIYDVLPTVFRVLDVPLAKTLVGHPVEQALTPAVLSTPSATVADYETIGERPATAEPKPLPADETLAKLRALGYVGSQETDRGGPRAVEGQDAVPLNRYNKGIILTQAGEWQRAIGEFRSLQKDEPELPLGFLGEGMARLERGESAAAVEPLKAAVRKAPGMATAHAALGEAYLRDGRLSQARRALEQSLRIEPNQGKTSELLGEVLMRTGELSAAASRFETARRLAGSAGERANACVGLAIVAEESGRLQEAASQYETALELAPGFPRALERYANLEMFRNRPEHAVDLLEQLIRAFPRNPGVLNLYGRALLSAKRVTDAHAVLKQSLEINPDQPEVRALLDDSRR